MPDLQDEDRQNVTSHLIDNPVVPDTQSKKPFFPAEYLHPPRARVAGQGVDPWLEAALNFRRESVKVTFRSRGEDDAVDTGLQLQPQLRFDLLPANRAFLLGFHQGGTGVVEVQAIL